MVEENVNITIISTAPSEVMVCLVADRDVVEGEVGHEALQERYSLFVLCINIPVAPDKECSVRVSTKKFLKTNFEIRKFSQELGVFTMGREVNTNMNRFLVFWEGEYYGDEGRRVDRVDSNIWVQASFPETEGAAYSMT